MDLKGKTAFITGASAGIGEGCAALFAREGVNLVIVARRMMRLSSLADRLAKEYNIDVYAGEMDVRDSENAASFVKDLPEKFKSIDILVNNAGLASGLETIAEGGVEDWDVMIDTNIKGLLHVTRSLLPGMIERGSGHIINIGSIAGRYAYPNGAVYCSTKFAVRALTQGLLMELVDTPIRISTVDPGLVETEFSLVRFKGDSERAKTPYKGLTPLTAKDIAEVVVFCASRPPHVNISELVLLPTRQASPYHAHRSEE